MSVTIRSLPN
uniref:Uncharacterized protein n=1 Tax=Anguilla anguilla TaxID=7936 RepID=A0A0E9QHZ2_ANGAN